MAEETAAGVFAVDDGSGTAEVEVDTGDGVRFEVVDGADDFGGIVADELGDDGALGGIFGDGAEDVGIESGMDVDAEIFGDVEVRSAAFGNRLHEGEVGNVLHGSEEKGGAMGGEEGAEEAHF